MLKDLLVFIVKLISLKLFFQFVKNLTSYLLHRNLAFASE